MSKDYILFDLDGTLTDPKVGITKSVQYSLKHFGIIVENADDLTAFIGPPLRESYMKFYGFSDDDAERAVARYREYFADTGIYENAIYGDIAELLDALHSRRKTLIVATSKPTVFAEKILEHFGIAKYFAFVSGSELDGRRSDKALVIQYAFENAGITEPHKAIMVGDRKHDIIGAKKAGIDSVGVLYGYGELDELTAAGADYITATVSELAELLRKS